MSHDTALPEESINPGNGLGPLSVDVKEQSPHKDNNAVLFPTALVRPNLKPCGHEPSVSDPFAKDGCWNCESNAPEVERSRIRTDRRRRRAQSWLVNLAPRWEGAEIAHYRKTPGVKGQSWFPVSACGIVPLGDVLTLDRRMDGSIDRHGVFRCGSVHTCPSCAQRIAQPRSRLIAAVIDAARAAGYFVAMWSLTMPHDVTTSLWNLIDRFHRAFGSFIDHRTVRRRLLKWGYLGHVNTYETTLALAEDLVTNNGFHYHGHGIVVLGRSEDLAAAGLINVSGDLNAVEDHNIMLILKDSLWKLWSEEALKAGSPRAPSYRHGFDIRPVWSSTDYIMKLPEQAVQRDESGNARTVTTTRIVDGAELSEEKRLYKERWGAENELTKSFVKEGRKKSRTPFELLDAVHPGDIDLFREYARCTYGRSTIEWSRGKRDLCRQFISEDYERRSDLEDLYAEPEWVFSDEKKSLPPEINFVVETAHLDKDTCWRARKAGRNALEKAIARSQVGGMNLPDSLRAAGFDVELVRHAVTIDQPTYDAAGEMVFEEVFLYEDPEEGIEFTGMHLRVVTTPVYRPAVYRAVYNLRSYKSVSEGACPNVPAVL